MIRWPGARSLLDYRTRRAEHGPVRAESRKKSELKDRREWRILEQLRILRSPCWKHFSQNEVWAHAILPNPALHVGAQELLSSGRAFWESSAVLEAAFQRDDTRLREKKTCSGDQMVPRDIRNQGLPKMGICQQTVSSLLFIRSESVAQWHIILTFPSLAACKGNFHFCYIQWN